MSEDICDISELKPILNRLVQAYEDVYGDKIRSIILYGSYARGTNQMDSDIDVVAIIDGDRPSLQRQLKLIWDVSSDLELEYGVIVSPTVIPSDEFERYKNILPYYRNIMNGGGGSACRMIGLTL